MAGEVAAVCISEKKGTAKQNIGSCNFIEDWGLEKDAHAGQLAQAGKPVILGRSGKIPLQEAQMWQMVLLVKICW